MTKHEAYVMFRGALLVTAMLLGSALIFWVFLLLEYR